MTDPIRLAKRLAELVPCSRREAELYIAGGWVTVDGLVVEEPQFMVSQQKVALHPEASLIPVEPATILFHQPPSASMGADSVQQLICADTRAAGRPLRHSPAQAALYSTDAVHAAGEKCQRVAGGLPRTGAWRAS